MTSELAHTLGMELLLFNFQGSEKILEKEKTLRETWGCSSVGRAPALQAGGHGFESHHLHHPTVSGPITRGSERELKLFTATARSVMIGAEEVRGWAKERT